MKKKLLTLTISLTMMFSLIYEQSVFATNKMYVLNSEKINIQTPRETGAFHITFDNTKMRTGPWEGYPVIATFNKGDILWRVNYGPTIDQTHQGWYKVTTSDGSLVGWVSERNGYPR